MLCWIYWLHCVKGKHLVISLTSRFVLFFQLTTVDKYASSWRQEIKSQKGSGLKRFRPSSDWQIEEFEGTCDCKNESDLPTESFCHLVFSKKKIAQKQPETTATVALR